MTRTSRRALLAAGAAGVGGTLAGCIGRAMDGLETFDGSVDVEPSLAAADSSWPVVHGDLANTRSVAGDAVPEPPLSVEWIDDYETHVDYVHPVGRDGTVIGSNWVDELYSVETETGERAWTTGEDDIAGEFEPRTTPVATDDAVLIGTRATLWSFDRDSGEQRWQTDEAVSLGPLQPGPTADDDLAFVPTTTGLAAHDLETGEREWVRQIGLRPTAVPAVVEETVYLGGGDATLHALERDSGAVRWRTNADGTIGAGPVMTDAGVYVGTDAGTVLAYDGDGTERWRTSVADARVETLAVGNGVVCAATSDDAITVVDPETGDRVWRSTRYARSTADGPVIGGRWIFASTEPSSGSGGPAEPARFGAFDAETGSLEWESDEPGFESGAAVVDGALYATGRVGEPVGLAKLS